MPTEDEQQHSVNDISHLFLSNVRSISGNGMPRPQRKPPGAQAQPTSAAATQPVAHVEPGNASGATAAAAPPRSIEPRSIEPRSIDLTPEEYEKVMGNSGQGQGAAEFAIAPEMTANSPQAIGLSHAADVAPVTALIASHLGSRQLERAREYARHVAASGERVGLIDLDVSEFRLFCFDPAVEPGVEAGSRHNVATGMADLREIAEAVEELNVDIDRWLVLLPDLRTPEAKGIIHTCESWTLLTTCDHDGIVSAYRTLKSVADARLDDVSKSTRLGLTTLDAAGDAEATRVQQKLAGVCRQFLGWETEAETPVRYAAVVAEHPLMNCRVTRDKAQLASAPHWTVVREMLARPRRGATTHAAQPSEVLPPTDIPASVNVAAEPAVVATDEVVEPQIRRVEPVETADVAASPNATTPRVTPEAQMPKLVPAPAAPPMQMASTCDDVIELPGDATDLCGILSAVLRRAELGVIECPLEVPTCATGRLVVTRERGLALVAATSRGLSELRTIGKAFQWMLENRSLIAMAMPQFAIDASRTPAIVLLVDQNDISGEFLRPMMQAEHVTVRAYRTLRWAGRTGLLLEAA